MRMFTGLMALFVLALPVVAADAGPGRIDETTVEAAIAEDSKVAAAAIERLRRRGTEGLGLALSRRLARTLGGDLRVEPNDDGACFVLTLPIDGADAKANA